MYFFTLFYKTLDIYNPFTPTHEGILERPKQGMENIDLPGRCSISTFYKSTEHPIILIVHVKCTFNIQRTSIGNTN